MIRARAAAIRAVGTALCVCASIAACSSATAPEAPAAALGELVAVEQGELLGATDGSVLRYRGIPYAAAPVGERRFTPPGRPQ